MGLDISAYRKLVPASGAVLDDGGYPVDWEKYRSISQPLLNFSNDSFGQPPRAGDLAKGVYAFSESMGFRAGSYSGYGSWRDWLAKAMGHGSAQKVWDRVDHDGYCTEPFDELICFADNEGVIGPTVAAKLAKDFADHDERVKQFCGAPPGWQVPPPGVNGEGAGIGAQNLYNLYKYAEWRKAFEMAADGGMVEFH